MHVAYSNCHSSLGESAIGIWKVLQTFSEGHNYLVLIFTIIIKGYIFYYNDNLENILQEFRAEEVLRPRLTVIISIIMFANMYRRYMNMAKKLS